MTMVVRTKKAAPKTPAPKASRAKPALQLVPKRKKPIARKAGAKKITPKPPAEARRPAQRLAPPPKPPAPVAAAVAPSGEITQLPAPSTSAQRIALKPGHYALRHLGFAPGIAPKNGLPFATVQVLGGEAALTNVTGAAVPVLRQPNDTVMVTVGAHGADVLIASFNHTGAQGPGFRFMLTPLALPQVAVTGQTAVPALAAAMRPGASVRVQGPQIMAIGHSERLGDVSYQSGEWIGGAGNVSLRLEGFILHMRDAPLGLAIEYGIVDQMGQVTWAREGALAGVRGQARAAYGTTARLMGAAATEWSISYECRFAGVATASIGRDGELCLSQSKSNHLTGVRFSLQRKSAAPQDALNVGLNNLQILAHIEREGDRIFMLGEWAGTPGSGKAIEGLQLLNFPKAFELQASPIMTDQNSASWISLKTFFGSRGKGRALNGLALRTSGADAKFYELAAHFKFVGDQTIYHGTNMPLRAPLEAIRISLTKGN